MDERAKNTSNEHFLVACLPAACCLLPVAYFVQYKLAFNVLNIINMRQNQMNRTGYSLEKNKVEAQKPLKKTGGYFLRKAIRVVEQTVYVKNYFKKTRQDAREAVRAGFKFNNKMFYQMKKVLISFVVSMATVAFMNAQTISVVDPSGTPTIYTDLNLAIQGATAGSTIYLSGGGFQVNDSTKITKKLTIIGIGHKPDNDNADGNTVVSGNFFFDSASHSSAVMGLYLSGTVNIGSSKGAVNNFLLRYCNVNSVQVKNSSCQGVLINQNYIRNRSECSNSAIIFTNNVLHSILSVSGGVINHNVVRHAKNNYVLSHITNSQISNNILIEPTSGDLYDLSNSIISNNMLPIAWGDSSYRTIMVTSMDSNIFVGPITSVSPNCNYHLKGSIGKDAGADGTDVGIYGGTGFSDAALPPIPRIVSKSVSEQTDENGNLKINVRVKSQ
jgi:hypothetical protein